MASGHSTAVVQCIQDPKFESLNLTVDAIGRNKMEKKIFI
jgi:hypothetical protein